MEAKPGGPVGSDAVQYRFSHFVLDVPARQLRKDGVPLPLSPRSLDVLALLVVRAGRPVSKRDLLDLIWPDVYVDEVNLAQHVSLLRKALHDSTKTPRFIATIPRVGYQFVARVESVIEAPAPLVGAGAGRPGPGRAKLRLTAAALVLLLAVAQVPGTYRTGAVPGADEAAEEGRRLLARLSSGDPRRSRVYFGGATARDPDDAAGWAGVAISVTAMYLSRDLTRSEALVEGRAAAERAVSLDPRSSVAHEAMGAVALQLAGEWPTAEAELRQAVVLDPRNAGALDLLARGLRQSGRFEESIDTARQALALAPDSARAHMNLATSLFFGRDDWTEAVDLCRRALVLSPNAVPARELLADLYEATGEQALAIETRANLEATLGRRELADALRMDYARVGFAAATTSFWRHKVDALRATGASPTVDFDLVRAFARAGDLDGTFDTLATMTAQGVNAGVLALRYHPMYANVQADPRLEPYLARPIDPPLRVR